MTGDRGTFLEWSPNKDALRGYVAVVAGATRGAGRGIAAALGEAGATVICTGRTTKIKSVRVQTSRDDRRDCRTCNTSRRYRDCCPSRSSCTREGKNSG